MLIAFDRPRIQQHWPRLSEDDLARIGSDRESLVRAIEDRYVCSNLEAEEQVVALEDQANDAVSSLLVTRGS